MVCYGATTVTHCQDSQDCLTTAVPSAHCPVLDMDKKEDKKSLVGATGDAGGGSGDPVPGARVGPEGDDDVVDEELRAACAQDDDDEDDDEEGDLPAQKQQQKKRVVTAKLSWPLRRPLSAGAGPMTAPVASDGQNPMLAALAKLDRQGGGYRRQRTFSTSAAGTISTERDPILLTSKRTIYTAGRPPWYDEQGQVAGPAFVIGICGGSASGKTTVAQKIIRQLDVPWVTLLSMDSFYKVRT